MPEPLYMTGFTLIARVDAANRAPRIYRVYGSDDGTSWDVIHDQTTNPLNNQQLEVFVPVNASETYRFFGLVVSRLFADGVSPRLNFRAWKIYGREDNEACPAQCPVAGLRDMQLLCGGTVTVGDNHLGTLNYSLFLTITLADLGAADRRGGQSLLLFVAFPLLGHNHTHMSIRCPCVGICLFRL
jgi:hypothetical protein